MRSVATDHALRLVAVAAALAALVAAASVAVGSRSGHARLQPKPHRRGLGIDTPRPIPKGDRS
jgi:hypothetical protein